MLQLAIADLRWALDRSERIQLLPQLALATALVESPDLEARRSLASVLAFRHGGDPTVALLRAQLLVGIDDQAARTAALVAAAPSAESEVRSQAGRCLLRAGALDDARAVLESLAADEPATWATWGNLGLVDLVQGDAARAVERLRRAVRIAPDQAILHYNLAAALKHSDPDAALAHARQARALAPGSARLVAQECEMLRRAGNPEAARAVLERAEAEGSTGPDLRYERGRAAHARGESALAREHLLACLDAAPAHAMAHHHLALVAWSERDRETALYHVREAAAKLPSASEPVALEVSILAQIGRMDEALTLAIKGRGRFPGVAELARLEGTILRHQGDLRAEAALREAIRLDPEVASSHFELAAVLETLGRTAEARDEAGEAARLHPRARNVHAMILQLAGREGDVDAMETELRRWAECMELPNPWLELAWFLARGRDGGPPRDPQAAAVAANRALNMLSEAVTESRIEPPRTLLRPLRGLGEPVRGVVGQASRCSHGLSETDIEPGQHLVLAEVHLANWEFDAAGRHVEAAARAAAAEPSRFAELATRIEDARARCGS